jgi:hypothetical protein
MEIAPALALVVAVPEESSYLPQKSLLRMERQGRSRQMEDLAARQSPLEEIAEEEGGSFTSLLQRSP